MTPPAARRMSVPVRDAAGMTPGQVFSVLSSSPRGLTAHEAAARLAAHGPNAVRTHRARFLPLLVRQLRNPLLLLLLVSASVSFIVGEHADSVIIGAIVSLSVGLGFANEYRAERAGERLHSRLAHPVVVRRDARFLLVEVTNLVPGDVIRLETGNVVPADARLVSVTGLECDESMLTGESMPVAKSAGTETKKMRWPAGVAFMGTVVQSGSADAVVIATGPDTEFGGIAAGLGERQPETEFQAGLRRFSVFLTRVALGLTSSILLVNIIAGRPVLQSVLFSLAIAVGITPQLLPAVVTTSLATGARRLARRQVLVKRLVCIEDLANVDVLLTDKTGTLTEGAVTLVAAVDAHGTPSQDVLLLGLACNEADVVDGVAVGGNPLDIATWGARGAAGLFPRLPERVDTVPFSHSLMRTTVLIDTPEGRILVTKGAPERVMGMCRDGGSAGRAFLDGEFDRGGRVLAVAVRAADREPVCDVERSPLDLAGFLVFADRPKDSAADALGRLRSLGLSVAVVTGDNATVAGRVCDALGLADGAVVTGEQLDAMTDGEIVPLLAGVRIFARMDPVQKTRVVRLFRAAGREVAYLGDGVNDAVALHAAGVGISVEGATDVARDAADIVMLQKDLHVLADGITEGRRIFANTVKYLMMGTSSSFGNMFSAAAASTFLSFLPMLPKQVLLNNLLYDAGQLSIPTDRVDGEQLARPAHWDTARIRRFMLVFGPVSSLFDFATFAVLIGVLDADPATFRTGWFVESLATQSLVIFVIRTARSPAWRSRPGKALTVTTLATVVVGATVTCSPLAGPLGFVALPPGFMAVLAVMTTAYLVLVEFTKRRFVRSPWLPVPDRAESARSRRINRRAARFSHADGPERAGNR